MIDKFDKFDLDKEILKALDILKYKTPTEVQKLVILDLLKNDNLLVKSKTGSGKSASFAIPICNNIKSLDNKLRALVIVPTRELAVQVKKEFENIGRLKRIKCSAILGKESFKDQTLELKQGINVVVATPGRIIDHITRENIDLSNLEYFVVDEVDKMFAKGFREDMQNIIKNVPDNICKSFFSATINEEIITVCNKYMKNYKYIEIEDKKMSNNNIKQFYIKTLNTDEITEGKTSKYEILKSIFYKLKSDTSIIFTNTKKDAENLYEKLKEEGFLVELIHGDISQERRFYIVENFKKLKFNILISSDIISRGIHIDNISLVVNYQIPFSSETYVHRIGRTGRLGKEGLAISLVSKNEEEYFNQIQEYINHKIEKIDIDYTEEDINIYNEKIKDLKENEDVILQEECSEEITKIHINLGKKKKIRIGDIVGTLNNIEGIENSDIGVIKIYENYSNVDILNKKGDYLLKNYSKITIKNKKAKIKKSLI